MKQILNSLKNNSLSTYTKFMSPKRSPSFRLEMRRAPNFLKNILRYENKLCGKQLSINQYQMYEPTENYLF